MATTDNANAMSVLGVMAMIFLCIEVIILLVTKNLIELPLFGIVPATILFSPLLLLFSDILAESYGFKLTRRLLYSSLIILGVIAFLVPHFILLHPSLTLSDTNVAENYGSNFMVVYHDLFKIYRTFFISVLVSDYLNILIVSKLRILVLGRYFWLRSLTASIVGAFCYSCLNLVLLNYINNTWLIIKIILVSFFVKIILLVIFSYPSTLIVMFLKKKGLTKPHNLSVTFNPFQ
jgi:queuosine precursor transporter